MSPSERAKIIVAMIDAHSANGGWATGSFVQEGIEKSIEAAISEARAEIADLRAKLLEQAAVIAAMREALMGFCIREDALEERAHLDDMETLWSWPIGSYRRVRRALAISPGALAEATERVLRAAEKFDNAVSEFGVEDHLSVRECAQEMHDALAALQKTRGA